MSILAHTLLGVWLFVHAGIKVMFSCEHKNVADWGTHYCHHMTLILQWMRRYMDYKVCNEITYHFQTSSVRPRLG